MTIEWIDKDGNKLASGRIVKDQERIRVPLMMADGAPLNIEALTKAAIADTAQPSAAMHRPGSLPLADADRAARNKALDARDKRLVDAWKNPPARQATVTDATRQTTLVADVTEPNAAWVRAQARKSVAWKMGMGATR